MARVNTSSVFLVLLIAASVLVAAHAANCSNDVNALREKCLRYVSASGPKIAPDANCCNAIQKANVPCVCKYITPSIEKIISADKLIYVAQYCRRPLKPGTKCGSVVVHG